MEVYSARVCWRIVPSKAMQRGLDAFSPPPSFLQENIYSKSFCIKCIKTLYSLGKGSVYRKIANFYRCVQKALSRQAHDNRVYKVQYIILKGRCRGEKHERETVTRKSRKDN
jgi:hypothetical protein